MNSHHKNPAWSRRPAHITHPLMTTIVAIFLVLIGDSTINSNSIITMTFTKIAIASWLFAATGVQAFTTGPWATTSGAVSPVNPVTCFYRPQDLVSPISPDTIDYLRMEDDENLGVNSRSISPSLTKAKQYLETFDIHDFSYTVGAEVQPHLQSVESMVNSITAAAAISTPSSTRNVITAARRMLDTIDLRSIHKSLKITAETAVHEAKHQVTNIDLAPMSRFFQEEKNKERQHLGDTKKRNDSYSTVYVMSPEEQAVANKAMQLEAALLSTLKDSERAIDAIDVPKSLHLIMTHIEDFLGDFYKQLDLIEAAATATTKSEDEIDLVLTRARHKLQSLTFEKVFDDIASIVDPPVVAAKAQLDKSKDEATNIVLNRVQSASHDLAAASVQVSQTLETSPKDEDEASSKDARHNFKKPKSKTVIDAEVVKPSATTTTKRKPPKSSSSAGAATTKLEDDVQDLVDRITDAKKAAADGTTTTTTSSTDALSPSIETVHHLVETMNLQLIQAQKLMEADDAAPTEEDSVTNAGVAMMSMAMKTMKDLESVVGRLGKNDRTVVELESQLESTMEIVELTQSLLETSVTEYEILKEENRKLRAALAETQADLDKATEKIDSLSSENWYLRSALEESKEDLDMANKVISTSQRNYMTLMEANDKLVEAIKESERTLVEFRSNTDGMFDAQQYSSRANRKVNPNNIRVNTAPKHHNNRAAANRKVNAPQQQQQQYHSTTRQQQVNAQQQAARPIEHPRKVRKVKTTPSMWQESTPQASYTNSGEDAWWQ